MKTKQHEIKKELAAFKELINLNRKAEKATQSEHQFLSVINLNKPNNKLKGQDTPESICVPLGTVGGVSVLEHLDIYYIPKSLNLPLLLSKLPKSDIDWTADKYIQGLYFVISYLMYIYAADENKHGHHINISRELLDKRFGKSPKVNGRNRHLYLEGIQILIDLGIIHRNNSYRSGDENSFTKSYKLNSPYAEDDYQRISFKSKRQPVLGIEDEEEETDVVKMYIKNNLKRLTLDEIQVAQIISNCRSNKRRLRIERAADKFLTLRFRIGSGETQRRVYHALTTCPKEFRSAVRLNNQPLIEADISSCQPILLLSISKGVPDEEITRYKEALYKDIYMELGGNDRTKAKKDFLEFALNDYSKRDFDKINRRKKFAIAFIERFPNISNKIKQFKGSMAAHLQNLEAEICLYTVIPELMKLGIFAISIHDAFLVKDEDFEIVKSLVISEFESRYNFTPTVKNSANKESDSAIVTKRCFSKPKIASCREIARSSGLSEGEIADILRA